jgi:hypothetical protein
MAFAADVHASNGGTAPRCESPAVSSGVHPFQAAALTRRAGNKVGRIVRSLIPVLTREVVLEEITLGSKMFGV